MVRTFEYLQRDIARLLRHPVPAGRTARTFLDSVDTGMNAIVLFQNCFDTNGINGIIGHLFDINIANKVSSPVMNCEAKSKD
jgi:hypothetical protein